MDPRQTRDQALNLADFKTDDILSVRGDRLLAEVAEDCGHPTHLADAFDAIASPVLSRHDAGTVERGAAAANSSLPHAALGAASLAAVPRPPRTAWSVRTALATLAGSLVTPRRRIALGACAALLLVAVLAPGIYMRLSDRSADLIAGPPADRIAAPSATPSKNEPTPLPELTSPQPQPTPDRAARGSTELSAAISPTPPSAPPATQVPQPTEDRQATPATQPTEVARQAPPPAAAASRTAGPRSLAAADAPAAAPAQAPLQRQAAAKARPGEGSGFVVQLAAAKTEAQARATFRDLRSRYAVLQGREPVIRRKEAGNAVSYAVQVGPFGSQAEAEELCGQLKAAGGSCFPTKN